MRSPSPTPSFHLAGLTALLLSAVLALAACGNDKTASTATPASAGPASAAAPAGSGQVLRIAESIKHPPSLALEGNAAFTMMNAGAVETLVEAKVDGQVLPLLATQWRRTGNTTWEFDLRPNVKFHDGSALDAETVVTALTFAMNASIPPRALKGTGLKLEAVTPHTVKLTTKEADPVLPMRLGGANTAILAKGAYAGKAINPIGFGSGPYKIVKHDPGMSITLEPFADYWGGKPQLAGVEVRAITDPAARFNALKVGEIHVAESIAPTQILQARKDGALHVPSVSMPRSATLYTNVTKGILQNLKIRQAIDLLIDREAIVNNVLEGTAVAAAGYFGDAVPWAPKAAPRPVDYLEQAKKLIAESGVKPADLKLNLLTYVGRPELAEAINIIKSNLEPAGFVITLDVADYNSVVEPKFLAKQHDLLLLSRSYYIDMPDAVGFLASDMGCEGSYNLNVFCDKAFDAIWKSAIPVEKPEDRAAIFTKAAQYLIDHKIGLPIYHDTVRRVFSAKVHDAIVDPLDQRLVTYKTTLAP